MTSLTDVYGDGVGTVVDRRQRLFGMTVFGLGTALVVGAIPLATTDVGSLFGLDVIGARHVAGILAGLGVPAVFLGIFAVLPAKPVTRAAAAIGGSLALFGVGLFATAYPERWLANEPSFAIGTILVYAVGTLVTFWCLFVTVATVKIRNDPGGTAQLKLTDEGTIRVISDDTSETGGSGIGLFGREPDGDVPTQTGEQSGDETFQSRQERESTRTVTGDGPSEPTTAETSDRPGTPTTDGASAVTDPTAVEEDVITAIRQRGRPDEYCGNCSQFEYVRANGRLEPYCALHSELLDDMDACEQWTSNNR